MAESIISTKLRLNTNEFDNNINKSKRQISSFNKTSIQAKSQIGNMFTGAIKGAGAFGLALVGINGLNAAFKTLLDSNQSFGDGFNNTMSGCKTVFDDFVQHLTNADLSGFASNVENAFKSGVESAKAYDQLGNTKMSYNVAASRKLEQVSDIDAQLSKETDTDKRNELITQRNVFLNELKGFANTLNTDVVDALSKGVNAALGGAISGDLSNTFTEDMFVKASEIDLDKDNRDSIKSAAEVFYKEFQGKINPMIKNVANLNNDINERKKAMAISSTPLQRKYLAEAEGEREMYMREISEYTQNLSEAERQHLLNYITLFRFTDEQLQGVYNEMQTVFNSNRVINRLAKREPKVKIDEQDEAYKNDTKTTPQSPVSVNYTKDQLEESKRLTGLNKLKGLGSNLLDTKKTESELKGLESIIPETKVFDVNADISSFKSKMDEVKDSFEGMTNSIGYIGSSIEGNLFGTSTISRGLEMIDTIDSMKKSYVALADMQKLMADQSLASAMIESNASDIKSEANEKEAQSAMVAFSAQMLKFFSWAGPIAPVLAMATTMASMSVLGSALNAIPKFATGGIAAGGTISGDKMPALINNDELILNPRQQTRLFNQLNSRERFDGVSGGNVEFKIKGDQLVGILNKTNKQEVQSMRTINFKNKDNEQYNLKIYSSQSSSDGYLSKDSVIINHDEIGYYTDLVASSSLQFTLIATSNGQYRDLYTTSQTGIKVELLKGSQVIYKGFIDSEIYEEDFNTQSNYAIDIKCGNVKILKRIDFDGSGRMKVVDALQYCLDKIDMKLNFNSQLKSGSINCKDFYINTDIFQKDGEFGKCYDVIEAVLNSLCLRSMIIGDTYYVFDNAQINSRPVVNYYDYSLGEAILSASKSFNKAQIIGYQM